MFYFDCSERQVPKRYFTRSKRRRNIFKARKVTQASLWIQNSYQSFFKARVCVRIISWMKKPAPPVSHLSACKVIVNISKTQKWFQLTSITSCKLHFESSQSLNLLDKLHTQPIFCFARISSEGEGDWSNTIDASSALKSANCTFNTSTPHIITSLYRYSFRALLKYYKPI